MKPSTEARAATSISLFWLKSAERILARNEKPAKLSAQVDELVLAQYEAGGHLEHSKFNQAANARIAAAAIQDAKDRLNMGQHPTVLAFFAPAVAANKTAAADQVTPSWGKSKATKLVKTSDARGQKEYTLGQWRIYVARHRGTVRARGFNSIRAYHPKHGSHHLDTTQVRANAIHGAIHSALHKQAKLSQPTA